MPRKVKIETSVPRSIKRYGWVPDLPDQRDHLYAAPPQVLLKLPSKVDLRSKCPPVYDQGELGSCTANAIGGAFQFEQIKQKQKSFVPSRLFIYYNERVIEGTVNEDSGAQIRDGIKTCVKIGVCPETCWPYEISQFTVKPPDACYQEATKHQVLSYRRLTNVASQLKGCLASGYPFVFGFSVYESFESPQVAKTGHAPMPQPGEKQLGGHAVLAVGYDDKKQWYVVRNSWGKKWGMKGYFTLPYAYLADSNLVDDFWTIRLVE
ncbi:MAG TPA: C1 family peptidase [Terriglobia bacterium]|nr:C1 family peptidase [Terriglobia bacterium]